MKESFLSVGIGGLVLETKPKIPSLGKEDVQESEVGFTARLGSNSEGRRKGADDDEDGLDNMHADAMLMLCRCLTTKNITAGSFSSGSSSSFFHTLYSLPHFTVYGNGWASGRHFLEKRKPRGIIDLHGASAKRKNDDEDREHVFVIFYPQDIHKEIQHLQGSCDQQITHWINTINELSEEEL